MSSRRSKQPFGRGFCRDGSNIFTGAWGLLFKYKYFGHTRPINQEGTKLYLVEHTCTMYVREQVVRSKRTTKICCKNLVSSLERFDVSGVCSVLRLGRSPTVSDRVILSASMFFAIPRRTQTSQPREPFLVDDFSPLIPK